MPEGMVWMAFHFRDGNANWLTNPAFDPVFDPLAMDAEAWLAMDETEFEARMGTTPLTRSGLARIRSNIAGTPGPE